MKLEFIDWKIRLVSSGAMQYDNKAWKLELVGDLPEGWSFEAMIANGENMDIIPLEADGTGAYAMLTAENLSLWGDYAVQIRGKNGDAVRHSNKIHVYIPNSLSGDAKWPELPTAFSRAEERIAEASEHPPVPGENCCWMIWDVYAGAYRQSDVPVTVAPVDRTADMTQPVGRDQDGRLYTAPGADGHTPEYGVDYGTPEQIAGIAQQAAEILQPDFNQLKNDITNLAPSGAEVGQLFRVAAISEDGKYTMEPVDLPSVGAEEFELLTKNAETGEAEPIVMDAETLRYNFPSLADYKKLFIIIKKTYAATTGLTGNVWFRYNPSRGFLFNPSYGYSYVEIDASLPGLCALKYFTSNNIQQFNAYNGTYTNVDSLESPYWVMPNTDWAEYYANCNTTITILGVRR